MRADPQATTDAAGVPAHALLKRFGRTSILAFGIQVFGVGISYLAHLLAARLAGPENYGLYAYVTAILVVLAYVAALGYDSAMLRFLPLYAERQAWSLVAGLIAFVERRVTVIALAMALLGFAGLAANATAHSAEWIWTVGLGLVLIPVWTLLLIRCAIVRALGNVLTAQLPERVLRDGGFMLLLGLVALVHPGRIDSAILMAAMILSALCALGFASRTARGLSSGDHPPPSDDVESAAWRRAAYPFLAMVAAEALINRCGVLILGASDRTADAGCFALISNLASLVILPRIAVNALLTPMIVRLYARRDLGGLELIIAKGALWSSVGACAIGGSIWFASPILLGWYGPTYLEGHGALGILIVGQVIATSAGAQLQLLKMTGREITAAAVLGASLALNVVLGLVLIPTLQLPGAALANLGCQVAWNLSMIPIIWRHLGIRPGIFRTGAASPR